ncbi:hypothetical protein K2O51_31265 (plasmid) [Cupriavidus pinatubonensis]|uniref:hypothetical protein n=1 Tax=Cupriavidus pinatubonensis TaxID=248026 RepID=UPI001C73A5ED|nr:hypothetical protein [Cupriavidus pinatubonensis]QYY33724.1 hypothetical protein K2O51_31265 [Cupriavidus pinatubonensis]
MAFTQRGPGQGKVTFAEINAKEGIMKVNTGERDQSTGKTIYQVVDTIEGQINGFQIRDQPSNNPQYKDKTVATIYFADNTAVSFSLKSGGDATYFGARLVAKLLGSDLGRPLSITPGLTKAGEKIGDNLVKSDMAWVSVKQDGEPVAPNYGVDGNGAPMQGLPAAPFLKLANGGDSNQRDYSALNEWVNGATAYLQETVTQMREAAKQPDQHEAQAGTPEEDFIDPDEIARAAQQREAA